mgnify:CR=1 FL=1
MKKLLIFLLLALSLYANAQNKKAQFFYYLNQQTGDTPYVFDYTDIPARPTLGTSATITYSAPGNILNSTGGTTQDKILSGAFTEFHAFSFTGDVVNHRRISNENSSTVIGSIANHLFNLAVTAPDYFELNGKSATEPLYFKDVGAVAATSAIQITGSSTTPHLWLQNIVNDSRGYAVFANTSGTLSGGSSTVPASSTVNYQDFYISFVRSFNATGNKEHFYLGTTTTTAYGIHKNLHLSHVFGYTSEWDGLQVENAENFTIDHATIINGGTVGTSSQNASLQIQNSYGSVTNSIFMESPQGLRITTQELTFTNNYVQWDGNEANQILSYYGNYAAANRLMVDPTVTEILIEDCDFVATTWTGALFDVLDPNVRVTIRNCRISGATSLFQDSRGGSPTGTLTDGGGNTFGATIPTPTFSNYTPTDFNGHGLLTEQTHHALGRGYRTPD